jgi:hypothetical protein
MMVEKPIGCWLRGVLRATGSSAMKGCLIFNIFFPYFYAILDNETGMARFLLVTA